MIKGSDNIHEALEKIAEGMFGQPQSLKPKPISNPLRSSPGGMFGQPQSPKPKPISPGAGPGPLRPGIDFKPISNPK